MSFCQKGLDINVGILQLRLGRVKTAHHPTFNSPTLSKQYTQTEAVGLNQNFVLWFELLLCLARILSYTQCHNKVWGFKLAKNECLNPSQAWKESVWPSSTHYISKKGGNWANTLNWCWLNGWCFQYAQYCHDKHYPHSCLFPLPLQSGGNKPTSLYLTAHQLAKWARLTRFSIHSIPLALGNEDGCRQCQPWLNDVIFSGATSNQTERN